MTIICQLRVCVVLALAVCATATSASAQTSLQKPMRPAGNGLYGDPDHSADLFLSLAQAYDDNLLAEDGDVNPTAPVLGGFYTLLGADAAYDWQGRRTRFGATGATAVRYYNDIQDFITSLTAGVGFSTELSRRTTLSANQTFAYSPSYLTGLFPSVSTPAPGEAPSIGSDYAVHDTSSYLYGTTVGISQGITRRGTLSGSVDYRHTDFISEDASTVHGDQSVTNVRVQFSRGMSRNVSLRVGYGYQYGNLASIPGGAAADTKGTEHGIDVGVDYAKPLSPTRRLTFSFRAGSGASDFGSAVPDAGGWQYRALADASVAFQFHRSWETRASYRRGLEYVPELTEPVYTDGISAALSGFFTPQWDLAASASYSTGASVLVQSVPAFDTLTVSARVRRSLNRKLAVYLAYVYYKYDFGTAAHPQPGVPSALERNGVRVGVTLWLPAVRR